MTTALLSALLFAPSALAQDLPADLGMLAPPDAERGDEWGIVNGSPATEQDNVMALVAFFGTSGYSFCSSTQIGEHYVLTAAHCVDAALDYMDRGAEIFVLRTEQVSATSQEDWFQVKPNGIFVHPGWVSGNGELIHDVAVLETFDVIETELGPASLNDEPMNDWVGRDLKFVGFGVTGDEASDGGVKRKTHIPIDQVVAEIVLSYDPNTNTCYGDSGGAAFGTVDGSQVLVGVNSFAFSRDGSDFCSGGGNGAARVDYYLDWIVDIIGTEARIGPANPDDGTDPAPENPDDGTPDSETPDGEAPDAEAPDAEDHAADEDCGAPSLAEPEDAERPVWACQMGPSSPTWMAGLFAFGLAARRTRRQQS
jgi:hypothetical protein